MQKSHEIDKIIYGLRAAWHFFAFLRAGEFPVQAGKHFDPAMHLTPRDVEVDLHSLPQNAGLLGKREMIFILWHTQLHMTIYGLL